MRSEDPLACRRALRDIREIVAVARLDGARMSEQEALQTIAAIADWAAGDGAAAPADCGAIVSRLDAVLESADIDGLDDRAAIDLFREVTQLLQAGASTPEPATAP